MSNQDTKHQPKGAPNSDPLAQSRQGHEQKELQRKIEILGTAVTFGVPLADAINSGSGGALANATIRSIIEAVAQGLGMTYATSDQLLTMSSPELVEELNSRLRWIAIESVLSSKLCALPDEHLSALASDEGQISNLVSHCRDPFDPRFERSVQSVVDHVELDMAVAKPGLQASRSPVL